MKMVLAQQVFDECRSYLEGMTPGPDSKPHPQDTDKAIHLANELLNKNPGHPVVMHVLASAFLRKGYFALAVNLFNTVTAVQPQFPDAWNNLGLAYRGMNEWDKARHACERSATMANTAILWANVAGTCINRGTPEQALEYANKGLEIEPGHVKCEWHKALALLEMGDYSQEAWDMHEARLRGGANENIANRNYHSAETTPWWDGGLNVPGSDAICRVAIHGEQGMGDEIMFASCLPDAIASGAEIILEPSPRVAGLLKRAFPELKVHGTDEVDGHEWIEKWGRPDAKLGMGSLPRLYRNSGRDSFPGTPYLKPDPVKLAHWGAKLRELGDSFRIGLAWQGGVPVTRVETRSFHPRLFEPLFDLDAQFFSLQYDSTAQHCCDEVEKEFGTKIHHFPKAVEARDPDTGGPSNLEELAAFIKCLDLVITVPQTCYHIAGGLGVPTYVLTPTETDWRLQARGEQPWYGCVELFRQKTAGDWPSVIRDVRAKLGTFVTPVKKVEEAAA